MLRVDGESTIPYWPYTDVSPEDLKEESKELIVDDAAMSKSGIFPTPEGGGMKYDSDSSSSSSDEGNPDVEGLKGKEPGPGDVWD